MASPWRISCPGRHCTGWPDDAVKSRVDWNARRSSGTVCSRVALMPLSESDTRAKLIDPAIHRRGWTEDLIRREETAGAIEIGDAGPRRRARGSDRLPPAHKSDEREPAGSSCVDRGQGRASSPHARTRTGEALRIVQAAQCAFRVFQQRAPVRRIRSIRPARPPPRAKFPISLPRRPAAAVRGGEGFPAGQRLLPPRCSRATPVARQPAATTRMRPSARPWRSWPRAGDAFCSRSPRGRARRSSPCTC